MTQSDIAQDAQQVEVKRITAERSRLEILTETPPHDPMLRGGVDHYLRSGTSALECIDLAIAAAGKEGIESVLDLPCGYGRQLRTLKAAFPDASFTACDVDREAVDFCARVFGATPVYSTEDPGEIELDGQGTFDLIWSGSLLTHLRQEAWGPFFRFFESALAPGGILVFTVHGRYAVEQLRARNFQYALSEDAIVALLEDYDGDGFGYVESESAYSAGITGSYGISMSSPAWVCGQLTEIPGLRLLTYAEAGWHDHHDAVGCVKAVS
jgi:SAM-dependent methyltransferase